MRGDTQMDLEQVMSEYGDYCYKIAYLYVKDFGAAEEIVQDVFIDFHTKQKFLGLSSIKTFLVKMTVYKSQNYLRSFKALKRQWTATYDEKRNEGRPDEIITLKEQQSSLVQAMFTLPIKYREILIFYYYEDYTIKEISQLLGISENTVKTRLVRGREKLKPLLQDKEEVFDNGFMEGSN